MRLGELPRIHSSKIPKSDSDAATVWFDKSEDIHPETPLADLDFRDAPAILVIEPNVVPNKEAPAILPENILLNSEYIFGYPAKSVVSGSFHPQGAWVVPKAAIEINSKTAVCDLASKFLVPRSIGTIYGNNTPEEAFETAFNLARSPKVSFQNKPESSALAASVGMDARNGLWWILGTFSGMSKDDDLVTAWTYHSRLLSAPDDISHHLEAEARRIRVTQRVPVTAISSKQSLALRATLSEMPGAEYWKNFDQRCRTEQGALADLANIYQAAGQYLWDTSLAQ